MKKIVVTGATGFVGRQLVPMLQNSGAHLLLVGRSLETIRGIFPDLPACNYDQLSIAGKGYDLLLHLAVLNNNVEATPAQFEAVNVGLTLKCVEAAKSAGIERFVFISSVHALDPANVSRYAVSKREAYELLKQATGLETAAFFLPAVTGDSLSGKLSMLNRLPPALRPLSLSLLGALRPTVNVEKLASAILLAADHGTPLARSSIISDAQEHNVAFGATKRAIDLAFAITVVCLFWWGLAIIYFAVRMQSRGPGVFAQRRIGRHGREFVCYKFRTMYVDTPNVGTHDVARSAITPLGDMLRKSKLDELPQVWNILRNDMSLIGPRPCLPSQTELIEERRQRGVLGIKPGISGYAQINGIDMSEPVRLAEWDERYLKLRSIVLDIKIILATALGRGGGDRVKEKN